MMNFKDRIESVYENDIQSDEGASLVELVLITGAIAVIAAIALGWLARSISNKSADVSECIERSSAVLVDDDNSGCDDINHSEDNSFKDTDTYGDSFGD